MNSAQSTVRTLLHDNPPFFALYHVPLFFYSYAAVKSLRLTVVDLDLWLDIKQHTSLCRVYVRELRRSVLVATPDFEKDVSERGRSHSPSSDERGSFDKAVYDRPPHAGGGHIGDHNISPFLRSTSQQGFNPENPSLGRASTESDSIIPRQRMINRSDLRSAAEKILYTYLLPGSEREVVLPREMVLDIQTAIEKDQRDDPEIFDAAREYIFQAMEREAFPGFLRQKALGNLIRVSSLARLIIGLLALFGGFWAGFAMIFLGYSRVTRCWVSPSKLPLDFLLCTS